MPDGSDAEAVISAIRERLDRQRSSDYRHAQERQEREAARWKAMQAEAVQREAATEQAAREASTLTTATDATTGQAVVVPKAANWTRDNPPMLLKVPLIVFALITWPLVRPILKTSPGWPRVIAAVLYWGWIAFLVIFLIRLATRHLVRSSALARIEYRFRPRRCGVGGALNVAIGAGPSA
jgi:hypothetical protein